MRMHCSKRLLLNPRWLGGQLRRHQPGTHTSPWDWGMVARSLHRWPVRTTWSWGGGFLTRRVFLSEEKGQDAGQTKFRTTSFNGWGKGFKGWLAHIHSRSHIWEPELGLRCDRAQRSITEGSWLPCTELSLTVSGNSYPEGRVYSRPKPADP